MSRAGSKPPPPSDAGQLVADVALEGLERGREQIGAADAVLLLPRLARRARMPVHADAPPARRACCGWCRSPRSDRFAETEAVVVHRRRAMLATPSFWKARPVAQRHAGVDQRPLHAVDQRLLLCRRQVGHQVRDEHVPARHHDVAGPDVDELAVAAVGDDDVVRRSGIAVVPHVDDRAAQADARGLAGAIESSRSPRARRRRPPGCAPGTASGISQRTSSRARWRCRRGSGCCRRRPRPSAGRGGRRAGRRARPRASARASGPANPGTPISQPKSAGIASAPTQNLPRPVAMKNHRHCLSTLATSSR